MIFPGVMTEYLREHFETGVGGGVAALVLILST